MDTVSDREPKGEEYKESKRERNDEKDQMGSLFLGLHPLRHFTRRNPDHRPQPGRDGVHSSRNTHTRTSDIQLGLGCRWAKVYKALAFLERDSNGMLHHHKVGLEWSGEFVVESLEVGGDGVAETEQDARGDGLAFCAEEEEGSNRPWIHQRVA
jgi:hypothetical protein